MHHHLAGLADDHAAAQRLAAALDGAGGARVVPPDTNIVMLDLPQACADDVAEAMLALGVRASSWSHARVRFVTHRDVDHARLAALAPAMAECVAEVLARVGR